MGQVPDLFQPDDVKQFISIPLLDQSFGIRFDTVTVDSGGTEFRNFKLIGEDYLDSDTCYSWGGCTPINMPSWLGRPFRIDTLGLYQFVTIGYDALSMAFVYEPDQPQVFFSDNQQVFSIQYEETAEETVEPGFSDVVHKFRIIHSDLNGNPINSPLNDAFIKVGETLGLIEFFRIDWFPTVLTPVKLIGSLNHQFGYSRMTNEMVYNYQPGDEIQTKYYYSHSNQGFMLPYSTTSYSKATILSRTDTEDQITYLVDWKSITNSGEITTSQGTVSYNKYESVSEYMPEVQNNLTIDLIPVDYHYPESGAGVHYYKNLSYEDYCGIPRFTFDRHSGMCAYYCSAENAWCGVDMQGVCPSYKTKYVAGIGMYYYRKFEQFYQQMWQTIREIVYYKKDGITCGTEVLTSVESLPEAQSISIFPNPSDGHIQLSGPLSTPVRCSLFSISGSLVEEIQLLPGQTQLDYSHVAPGIYLHRIQTLSGSLLMQGKVVISGY